jgi:hypothetical protein
MREEREKWVPEPSTLVHKVAPAPAPRRHRRPSAPTRPPPCASAPGGAGGSRCSSSPSRTAPPPPPCCSPPATRCRDRRPTSSCHCWSAALGLPLPGALLLVLIPAGQHQVAAPRHHHHRHSAVPAPCRQQSAPPCRRCSTMLQMTNLSRLVTSIMSPLSPSRTSTGPRPP